MGLREVQMAGRLGLTLAEYRALEAGGDAHLVRPVRAESWSCAAGPRGRVDPE